MPRKPQQKKQEITVVVDGKPIKVTLAPPNGTRKAWYAFWSGLTYSLSTGHRNLGGALTAAEDMVRNGGERSVIIDTVMSDEEFDEIQRQYYIDKKRDEKKRIRAERSYQSCVEAISAFRKITKVPRHILASWT